MSAATFWALRVSLGPGVADGVANFLWEAGAVGVVEEGEGPLATVEAHFPPGSDPTLMELRLLSYLDDLRTLGLPVGPGAVHARLVPDEAWAEAWRTHFIPRRVGRRLWVCPPWDRPAAGPGEIVVEIEPGRAFGTGAHATTLGCLELAAELLDAEPLPVALDVGTGSGILAIACARLGVPAVLAIDLDPDAVRAAEANVIRNGVAREVEVALATPEALEGVRVPLILANLLGPALERLAPHFARLADSPVWLIAGGLLVSEVAPIEAALGRAGFRPVRRLAQEGWATLLLVRGRTGP